MLETDVEAQELVALSTVKTVGKGGKVTLKKIRTSVMDPVVNEHAPIMPAHFPEVRDSPGGIDNYVAMPDAQGHFAETTSIRTASDLHLQTFGYQCVPNRPKRITSYNLSNVSGQ